MESSESWYEGALLYERLLTLPNYEKCAPALQRAPFALHTVLAQVLTSKLSADGCVLARPTVLPGCTATVVKALSASVGRFRLQLVATSAFWLPTAQQH